MCNSKFVSNDFCAEIAKSGSFFIYCKLNIVKIFVYNHKNRENHGKITAFDKNHGIHGNCQKSRITRLPRLRDFLLSLRMAPGPRRFALRGVVNPVKGSFHLVRSLYMDVCTV